MVTSMGFFVVCWEIASAAFVTVVPLPFASAVTLPLPPVTLQFVSVSLPARISIPVEGAVTVVFSKALVL